MTTGLPFLRGDRLYLRALLETDAQGVYPEWFNDAEACLGNSHHVFPYSRQAAAEYIRQSSVPGGDLVLAIVLSEDDRHVGNIALQNIHPLYRSADLTIIIGDRSVWNTGVGKEAARLLCDHGFDTLNLHRIACGTFASNTAMIRLAGHLGMREEGRRRQAAFKNGRYVDVIEFGVLRDEYGATRKRD